MVLRRPFSINTADPATGIITIHFRVIGRGTEWFTRLRPGDEVDLLGPLGRPFEVDARSRHLLLVAGGLGMAGVRMLADEAIRDGRQVTLLFGAASAREVYPSQPAAGRGRVRRRHRRRLAWPPRVRDRARPDVRGMGRPGVRVRAGADARRPRAACRRSPGTARRGASSGRKRGGGKPEPAGSPAARRKAFLQVSMEQNMGCAVGACLGCVVMSDVRHATARLPRGTRLRRRGDRLGGRVGLTAGRRRRVDPAGAPMKAKRRAVTSSPRVAEQKYPSSPKRVVTGPAPSARARPAATRPERRRPSPRPTSTFRSISGAASSCPIPILVASGTFGYGIEYGDVVDVDGLGGDLLQGDDPQGADRQSDAPRVRDAGRDAELDRSAEPGRRRRHREVRRDLGDLARADHRQRRRRIGARLRRGRAPARRRARASPASSSTSRCPNVGAGGLQFAIDAGAAGEVTAAVRRATDLPLLVKLSPNVADIRPIARAIADAGADALTAINTLSGIAVAPGRSRPLLGNIYGGLSGPAIKPVALRVVYEAVQAVGIPVVAIGGVTELADVLDFLAVGAVAVQVGTAIFADPTLPVRLVDELAAECGRRGLTTYRDLIGTALPAKKAGRPSAKGVEYRP